MAGSERAYLWISPFFGNLAADRVRFALTRYFSRKAQVAEIPYTPDMVNTGFPVPRDFALAFLGDHPLKHGDSRKLKLEINGKQHDALYPFRGFGELLGQKQIFLKRVPTL